MVHLGGGRLKDGDRINPAVGLSDLLPLGENVAKGEAIAAGSTPRMRSPTPIGPLPRSCRLCSGRSPDRTEPDLVQERIG